MNKWEELKQRNQDEFIAKLDHMINYTIKLPKYSIEVLITALEYGANKLEEEDESDLSILNWRNFADKLRGVIGEEIE